LDAGRASECTAVLLAALEADVTTAVARGLDFFQAGDISRMLGTRLMATMP
jgi:hypothetical protein